MKNRKYEKGRTKTLRAETRWRKLSRKSPVDLRIPPLNIEILLESTQPLKIEIPPRPRAHGQFLKIRVKRFKTPDFECLKFQTRSVPSNPISRYIEQTNPGGQYSQTPSHQCGRFLKNRNLNCLPDPGPLNSYMHAFPETDVGFAMFWHMILMYLDMGFETLKLSICESSL